MPTPPPSLPRPESALTPNRQVTVTYDIAETVIQEEHWGGQRMGRDVAQLAQLSLGADNTFAEEMHFWSCGCWTLRPIQFDVSHLEKDFPGLVYDVTVGG